MPGNIKGMLKRLIGDKEARGRVMQALSFVPDKPMVKFLYKLNTGSSLNLDDPRTFNEKIQWYKLYWRDPLMTRCTDKLLVKDYVREKGYSEMVTPTYAVWDAAEDIDFDLLPAPCIIKCNHNSNGALIWNGTLEGTEVVRARYRRMMRNNAFWNSREWSYLDIVPKIFAEELLVPKKGPLKDWNIFCFGGMPRLVLCNVGLIDESGAHAETAHRAAFDSDFNYLNIQTGMIQIPEGNIERPIFWNQMLEIASRLAEPFPEVRVDFFQCDGDLRFGELTFYSSGGYSLWNPTEWQLRMGDWFELPKPRFGVL